MTKQDIGKKIKAHRDKNGISKYRVAKTTNLTFAQLSAIEAGSKNYTINSLLEYMGAIGLGIDMKSIKK